MEVLALSPKATLLISKEYCPFEEQALSYGEDAVFEPLFYLSDRDLDLRLRINHLGVLIDNVCSQKEMKQVHPSKKLIIKQIERPVSSHEQINNVTVESILQSPCLLKSLNLLTSGLKKSVRFTDSIGLDLEYIKLFKNDINDFEDNLKFDDQPLSPTSFPVCLPLDLPLVSCCQLCVRCLSASQDFWDNSNGDDCKIDCCTVLPATLCADVDAWSIAQLSAPPYF